MEELPPHVQRMHDELMELNSRKSKLQAFMSADNQIFAGLAPVDQQLLDAQHTAMATYSTILALRISRA